MGGVRRTVGLIAANWTRRARPPEIPPAHFPASSITSFRQWFDELLHGRHISAPTTSTLVRRAIGLLSKVAKLKRFVNWRTLELSLRLVRERRMRVLWSHFSGKLFPNAAYAR